MEDLTRMRTRFYIFYVYVLMREMRDLWRCGKIRALLEGHFRVTVGHARELLELLGFEE